MNNNLLYFPYIDIPKNGWTTKSILYWDKIGIIVPPDYVKRPNQYKQFTIDLLQTELVEQIFPYNYTYQIKNFDDAFIKLVTQPKFNLERRQQNFNRGSFSRIHIQKFGERLMNQLVHMQIAKQKDWDWYYVESKTARLLMIYLATAISKIGDFTPATDTIANLDTSLSQSKKTFRLGKVRQNLIDDLIPYPIEPNLLKLRKFKDKFYDELTSFRIMIEQAALDIAYTSNAKYQDQKYDLKVAEINDKRTKILSELNQSKMGQITFGTICGIAGSIIGFSQDNHPLGIFSLANAIYSAFQGLDKRDALAKDFSYLALIDKNLKPNISNNELSINA